MNKDSLVRRKEYPMESSSKSRESVYIETSTRRSRGVLEQWSIGIGRSRRGHVRVATGSKDRAARLRRPALSQSDHDGMLCHDDPVKAAYQAVTVTGSVPESDREHALHGITGQNLPYLTHGDSKNHN
ncbi:hypothetical protein Taro_041306 [Colocasia esculenta]|uniref:Uncharacterized protein n=1 Tax=Colocasia esculenta TaxID=4460 RepID=A0A843X092_COLES|nr:hypothetical protein [Colocasia esculenta]